MKKTPIDFADELLQAWGRDFIETGRYKEWGMSYIDAMVQNYQWRLGAEDNLDTLKHFHNLLSLAIEHLENKEDKK